MGIVYHNFYADNMEGRLFPHALEINMTLKQSESASVGVLYNMLVIVLQFFWLFLFFL